MTSLFTDSTRSEFTPPMPDTLAERLAREPSEPNGQPDHFAVLLGANTEMRHRGNLSLAYQVLLEQGYKRENIYIFDSEGSTPFFPYTDFTSMAALEMLFERLAKVVEPHDTLFIYVTGHGRRIKADEDQNGDPQTLGVSTLILNPAEELSQDDFVRLIERVQPGVGIAFFDQCYWGQFGRDRLGDWVMITTADTEVTSHGVSFPRAFWLAFRQIGHAEPPTVLDAFKMAMVADKATRMGFNRPRISHGYIDPARLLLTGAYRPTQPTQASIEAGSTETRP